MISVIQGVVNLLKEGRAAIAESATTVPLRYLTSLLHSRMTIKSTS
jgi:hypothetical protein